MDGDRHEEGHGEREIEGAETDGAERERDGAERERERWRQTEKEIETD